MKSSPDFDKAIFMLFYFPIVVTMNCIHNYIMYEWLSGWAEGSPILICYSIWHYIISYLSIMLAYGDKKFMF